MAKQDYYEELIGEQDNGQKNRTKKIFVFSIILSVIILISSFFGGYYLAVRTKNIVSDETYEFLKNFDEDSINTINKFDLLFNALAYADDKFYQNLDYDKLDKVAALAVMNSLDDYSSMSSTEDLLNSAVSASVGVIISTSIYNEYTIQHVFEESSAYINDTLRRGDRIYAVKNYSLNLPLEYYRVEGLSSEYFRFYTSGGDGTTLEFKIDRPIKNEDGSITFKRIENVRVTKSLTTSKQAYYIDNLGGSINSNLGYIKLLSFTGSAYEDFKKCMENFEDDGNEALILDLRNNGGGSGEVLDKIASYLIRDKNDLLEDNFPIIVRITKPSP
jgi:C-terminal processing protease CtpA/Prc